MINSRVADSERQKGSGGTGSDRIGSDLETLGTEGGGSSFEEKVAPSASLCGALAA